MSDEEFNKLFSRRLRRYLEYFNMTQNDLAKKMGVGTTSVSNWYNGLKTPRMDKVDLMCDIFNCNRSDLISDNDNISTFKEDQSYYLNDETRAIAQAAYENEDMRILFDIAKDTSPERLKTYVDFLQKLKDTEK